jgi:hypothetical protein
MRSTVSRAWTGSDDSATPADDDGDNGGEDDGDDVWDLESSARTP